MDRAAVFVDAGYLLATGGLLCVKERSRAKLSVEYEPLVTMLGRLAREHTRLPLLRIYWYDAAFQSQPTADHLRINALPSTKVRLGRLSAAGVQKGTDALIYRDLFTLSRQGAMCCALLVSGDEDLREGVVAAQEFGVRVTVVGVAAGPDEVNQSAALTNEADENIVLGHGDLAPYFALRRHAKTPPTGVATATSREQKAAFGRDALEAVAEEAARTFAEQFLRRGADAVRELRTLYPRIPQPVDAELLNFVEERAGSLYHDESRRRGVRAAFWLVVRADGSRGAS